MSFLSNGKSQVVCIALSALVCTGFVFDAQRSSASAAELRSKIVEFEKARAVDESNKESNDQLGVSRSSTANRLSQELEVVCENTGVNLKQVQFDSATGPVSAAGGDDQLKGWGLNNATILLEGTAPQVFQALRQMGSGKTVFRIDQVSINRMVNSDGSVSGVSAEVKAAILVRLEGQS